MTPTERKVLAAARRWRKAKELWDSAVEDPPEHGGSPMEFYEETLDRADRHLLSALAADAKARKARKKSPKWKPETPSPYDLSERKRK